MRDWRAWYTTTMVEIGVRPSGKPRMTLVTLLMIAHTRADAVAIARKHPSMKFYEYLNGRKLRTKAPIESRKR